MCVGGGRGVVCGCVGGGDVYWERGCMCVGVLGEGMYVCGCVGGGRDEDRRIVQPYIRVPLSRK